MAKKMTLYSVNKATARFGLKKCHWLWRQISFFSLQLASKCDCVTMAVPTFVFSVLVIFCGTISCYELTSNVTYDLDDPQDFEHRRILFEPMLKIYKPNKRYIIRKPSKNVENNKMTRDARQTAKNVWKFSTNDVVFEPSRQIPLLPTTDQLSKVAISYVKNGQQSKIGPQIQDLLVHNAKPENPTIKYVQKVLRQKIKKPKRQVDGDAFKVTVRVEGDTLVQDEEKEKVQEDFHTNESSDGFMKHFFEERFGDKITGLQFDQGDLLKNDFFSAKSRPHIMADPYDKYLLAKKLPMVMKLAAYQLRSSVRTTESTTTTSAPMTTTQTTFTNHPERVLLEANEKSEETKRTENSPNHGSDQAKLKSSKLLQKLVERRVKMVKKARNKT